MLPNFLSPDGHGIRLVFVRAMAGIFAAAILFWTASALAEGQLSEIRDDVRTPSEAPTSDKDEPSDHRDRRRRRKRDRDDDDKDGFAATFVGDVCVPVVWCFLTSPFRLPHACLGDSFNQDSFYPRFPYDGVPGYLVIDPWLKTSPEVKLASFEQEDTAQPFAGEEYAHFPTRSWSCRMRAEYFGDFDNLSRIGGHVLLSSTSRFGLDTGFGFLEEKLPGDGHDDLALGDCNLVFRFAQGERAQFRAGLGFNWLNDEIDTNFGFNFTYGLDLFPCDPWVVSATIDWGTLKHAGLFHFRTTAGTVFHGLEPYAGFEYYDVGSTQFHGLVGGIRVWF